MTASGGLLRRYASRNDTAKCNKKQQKKTKRAGQGKPALPRVRLERQERQGEALRELKPYGLRELACAVN